jgi:hypothetical protein
MKKSLQMLLLAVGLIAIGFMSTGCETVSGIVYEDRVTEHAGTLAEDAIETSPGVFVPVADLEPGTFDPAAVLVAGSTVTWQTVEQVPSRAVETSIGIVSGLLGPYGGLAGLLATAGLGIYATATRKHLTKAERTEQALVQGIDTFRDILDQTPQGAVIDDALTKTLAKQQTALNVADHVRDLLRKYETPDKKPIIIKTSALS